MLAMIFSCKDCRNKFILRAHDPTPEFGMYFTCENHRRKMEEHRAALIRIVTAQQWAVACCFLGSGFSDGELLIIRDLDANSTDVGRLLCAEDFVREMMG